MIIIVDYEAGNITSVKRALDYLNIPSKISPDPDEVINAERIIFPGVGHAAAAMKVLQQRKLDTALKQAFLKGTPILGICIGTQIILSHSEEGNTNCLGLIDGECLKFSFNDKSLKIPHIGWNSISIQKNHPVLKSIKPGDEFYFVHSYYPNPSDSKSVLAVCDYGITFAAVIAKTNLIATQFHPEKSGPVGLKLLTGFSQWNGSYAE
ncbi:MAG TPA: imidazole glycerol phosphate synthase subunit HisH [Chitinispirillaceae bacterium]|nr:imidazole glycerol phosphate synthase subunit HisH [Chitinispirillaceae bacterium]